MVIDTLPFFSRTFPFLKLDTIPVIEDEIYNEMSGWPDGLEMGVIPNQNVKDGGLPDWVDLSGGSGGLMWPTFSKKEWRDI